MVEFKRERLEHLANILAEHCHRKNTPCIFNENIVGTCPFEFNGAFCEDTTPNDWFNYMQGQEVPES